MPAILSALFSRSSQPNRAHTLGGRPTAPITTPSGPGALWNGVGGEWARVAGFGPWPDKLKKLLRRRANVGTSARSWVRSGGPVCGLAAGGASMPHRFPALIAAPAPGAGRLCLTGLRLLDGTGGPVREGVAVLVEDGVIRRVTTAQEPRSAGAKGGGGGVAGDAGALPAGRAARLPAPGGDHDPHRRVAGAGAAGGPAGDALRRVPRPARPDLREDHLSNSAWRPLLRGHVPRSRRARRHAAGGPRADPGRGGLHQGHDHRRPLQ